MSSELLKKMDGLFNEAFFFRFEEVNLKTVRVERDEKGNLMIPRTTLEEGTGFTEIVENSKAVMNPSAKTTFQYVPTKPTELVYRVEIPKHLAEQATRTLRDYRSHLTDIVEGAISNVEKKLGISISDRKYGGFYIVPVLPTREQNKFFIETKEGNFELRLYSSVVKC